MLFPKDINLNFICFQIHGDMKGNDYVKEIVYFLILKIDAQAYCVANEKELMSVPFSFNVVI